MINFWKGFCEGFTVLIQLFHYLFAGLDAADRMELAGLWCGLVALTVAVGGLAWILTQLL